MKRYLFILLLTFIVANNPPISDPGADQNVSVGSTVTLDGSKSYDLDGDDLGYTWSTDSEQVSSDVSPTFTAPSSSGVITFKLTVNDGTDDSEEYSASDIFISEYHDALDSRNKYLEIFNGTGGSIDLTGYELWIVKEGKTPEDGNYEGVLLSNSDASLVDPDVVTSEDNEKVTNMIFTDSLYHNETMIIIRSDGILNNDLLPTFDIDGLTTAVMPYVWKIGGDEWVALFKDGDLIDRVGEDDVPSSLSGWDVAGESQATKDGALVRKPTVVGGNLDWTASAGTNADDSEWIYYSQSSALVPADAVQSKFPPTTVGFLTKAPSFVA
jgi:hypothetical protein